MLWHVYHINCNFFTPTGINAKVIWNCQDFFFMTCKGNESPTTCLKAQIYHTQNAKGHLQFVPVISFMFEGWIKTTIAIQYLPFS